MGYPETQLRSCALRSDLSAKEQNERILTSTQQGVGTDLASAQVQAERITLPSMRAGVGSQRGCTSLIFLAVTLRQAVRCTGESAGVCRLLEQRAASDLLLAPAYRAAATEQGCPALQSAHPRRGLTAVASVLLGARAPPPRHRHSVPGCLGVAGVILIRLFSCFPCLISLCSA